MTTLRHTRPIHVIFARLAVIVLAIAALLPGQPTRAAAVPIGVRPAPPLRVRSRPANNPPVANDDNLVAFTNQDYQTLYVLDNDTDPDSGDTINIFSVSSLPQHGQIFRNTYGLDYLPDPGYSGIDTFNYVVEDRPQFTGGLTDTATVTVTVIAPGAVGTTSGPFAVYACLPSPSGCDTSRWKVNPKGGATGVTASGICNGAAGLGVADATLFLSDRVNAFDNGLTLWINGHQFLPKLPMTVTHYSLLSGPVMMAGARVTVRYDGMQNSDTLRTEVILSNTTSLPKTITATLASNLGSNAQTIIFGSSSGDTAFTASDRWLVTSNSASNPSGIIDTHVLFGPGSPAVTASAVYSNTFKCNESPTPNSRGVRADFHLVVPAGTTQRLLFFNQAHDSNAGALADAAVFNVEPVSMLGGLTNAELAQVVNWNLGPISRLYLPLVQR
jgi:hypothetical protein